MKSQYSVDGNFYEWDAFRKLSGKLHEGDVKAFIKEENNKGNRLILEDYKSLFSWVLSHPDKDHLLSDALSIWWAISKKVGHSYNAIDKQHEYNMNRIRLSQVNYRARELYEAEKEKKSKNRSLLRVLADSAIFLREFDQPAEILEDLVETGNNYDLLFFRNHLKHHRDLPPNVKKLYSIKEKREFSEKNEKIEEMREKRESSRNTYAKIDLDYIINEPRNPERMLGAAFSVYQKEKEDEPCCVGIMEKAISNR